MNRERNIHIYWYQHYFFAVVLFSSPLPAPPQTGGYKEMSSILANQWSPRIWAQMRERGGGIAGFLAPMSTAVHTGAHITPYLTYVSNRILSASIGNLYLIHREKKD